MLNYNIQYQNYKFLKGISQKPVFNRPDCTVTQHLLR